ncbi:MAG: hypothetical protein PVG39_07805 [Desulfobacteraceae bacterium]|jgi:hypothetical protein
MAKRLLICSFLIIALLSAAGIYHIFSIRFKIGDVYPPYSSLRTDPLGTKIFFESLSGLNGCSLKRDYDPVPKWEGSKETTLFLLGTSPGILEISHKENRQILSWVLSAGTRVVISLNSQKGSFITASEKDEESKKDEKDDKNSKKDEKDKDNDAKTDYSLTKLLGFKITPFKKYHDESAELTYTNSEIDLPQSLKYRPANYFTDLNAGWTVIYSQKDKPVIIFRKYGQGTIILCADSYIFSNEAMMSHRYPGLLSWLTGAGKNIYFDESHFGLQKKTGMIDLAYKYRLQGVIFVFIFIALLYVWKNIVAFVPPRSNSHERIQIIRSDRDYLDGLISLLQRYIPEKELIKTCIEEWEKATAKGRLLPGAIRSARDLEQFTKNYDKPSQVYNSISKKLKERKSL